MHKTVSPCDLSIILVQLLVENRVHVNRTADGKIKDFKTEIHTVNSM